MGTDIGDCACEKNLDRVWLGDASFDVRLRFPMRGEYKCSFDYSGIQDPSIFNVATILCPKSVCTNESRPFVLSWAFVIEFSLSIDSYLTCG